MKDNQHVKPVINLETREVSFEVKGLPTLTLHMEKLHPSIVAQAAMVGMAQVRIVDAAAIGRTDKDGRIIPEAERIQAKWDAMQELIAHYETGTDEWSRRASGDGAARTSLAIEALAEIKGVTVEKAREQLEAYAQKNHMGDTKAALAYLAQGERMQKKILEIRTRRVQPKVDADAALGEIE